MLPPQLETRFSRGLPIPPAISAESSRLPFLDLLRALASHLIVWHHLAFYGPMSDVAYSLAPRLIDLLFDHGRAAVQIFFVVGGMLTARTLARGVPLDGRGAASAVWRRYRRIGFPYLAALGVAVGANEVARSLMDHSSISGSPTLGQLFAHVLFLQHILGYEALTAGIWYLAIDFQMVLLTLLILGASARGSGSPARSFWAAQAAFGLIAVASLFWFNRDSRLDNWAIYFFGSFFLGMAVQWTLSGKLPRSLLWSYAGLMVAAMILDWRRNLLVALITGLSLYGAGRSGLLSSWPRNRVTGFLGRISYSLFLIHFPVCLVINACVWRVWPESATWSWAGMVAAYLLSIAAATVFHRFVEARFLSSAHPPPKLAN
jgi:peptidoglycan/LPS O-acetylase OafA/YrhL